LRHFQQSAAASEFHIIGMRSNGQQVEFHVRGSISREIVHQAFLPGVANQITGVGRL
jgi:hypothetical protein